MESDSLRASSHFFLQNSYISINSAFRHTVTTKADQVKSTMSLEKTANSIQVEKMPEQIGCDWHCNGKTTGT